MTITNDDEYTAALARIHVLMDAEPDTPEADELVALADAVEVWEREHYPIPEDEG
jgi:HTH-type transcriptional regulator/antitoxin HigA